MTDAIVFQFARRDRYSEQLVDQTQVTDHPHLPPVEPDEEGIFPRQDSHQPLPSRDSGKQIQRDANRRKDFAIVFTGVPTKPTVDVTLPLGAR